MSERRRSFLDVTLPHLDSLYRLARRVTRDRDAAEDLVQETYLRAFAHYGEGAVENPKAWLTTICLNLVRSDARKRSRQPGLVPLENVEREIPAAEDVFDQARAALTRDEVESALASLPEQQRLAIVLMDLVGHSASEVAALLDCPRGTVLARVHRGRRRLAVLLSQRGIGRDVL